MITLSKDKRTLRYNEFMLDYDLQCTITAYIDDNDRFDPKYMHIVKYQSRILKRVIPIIIFTKEKLDDCSCVELNDSDCEDLLKYMQKRKSQKTKPVLPKCIQKFAE